MVIYTVSIYTEKIYTHSIENGEMLSWNFNVTMDGTRYINIVSKMSHTERR